MAPEMGKNQQTITVKKQMRRSTVHEMDMNDYNSKQNQKPRQKSDSLLDESDGPMKKDSNQLTQSKNQFKSEKHHNPPKLQKFSTAQNSVKNLFMVADDRGSVIEHINQQTNFNIPFNLMQEQAHK